VVGDIHGCFATLDLALEEIGFDTSRDRLFSVGDLVDRGPESARALEYLQKPWFHAVRGNHEQMLLDAADQNPRKLYLWWANGGVWFVDETEEMQAALTRAIAELPLIIEVGIHAGAVGIVHADVPRKMSWQVFVDAVEAGNPKAVETALWGRNRAMGRVKKGVAGVDRVFCGHTPMMGGIRAVGNVYCIDTGAVYGLTQGFAQASLAIMQLTGNQAHMRAVINPTPSMPEKVW
jgi:serine/threonine protein phosphatase 1